MICGGGDPTNQGKATAIERRIDADNFPEHTAAWQRKLLLTYVRSKKTSVCR
jgi:hypothetical protein